MRAPPSLLKHLPEAPSPQTIAWSTKSLTCEFWGDTNVQTITPVNDSCCSISSVSSILTIHSFIDFNGSQTIPRTMFHAFGILPKHLTPLSLCADGSREARGCTELKSSLITQSWILSKSRVPNRPWLLGPTPSASGSSAFQAPGEQDKRVWGAS